MNVQPEGQNPFTLFALSDRFSDRTRRLLSAYVVGQGAQRLGKRYWDKWRATQTYTVAVLGDDSMYRDVHSWLLASLPEARRRALTAQSVREGRDYEAQPIGAPTPPRRLRLFYDSTKSQTVEMDGHRIEVTLERPDWSNMGFLAEESRFGRKYERIIFTAGSVEAREAVLGFLGRIADEQTKRSPQLRSIDRWSDGWRRMEDLPSRPLDTVVLRAGQKERLVEDLSRFLTQEADYARYGIPWHRGYLFHGPAGTGKTSLARALASHLNLDIYAMPLAAVKDDSVLNGLFGQVESRSVLLLEDIDVVHGARDNSEGPGVTLQGLLNTLDGFATPHGLTTILTTNDRSVLDPRLIRPGRVDVTEEIGYLDDDQLRRLVTAFLGEHPTHAQLFAPEAMTPADIVGILKRHLHDGTPGAARMAISDMIYRHRPVSEKGPTP